MGDIASSDKCNFLGAGFVQFDVQLGDIDGNLNRLSDGLTQLAPTFEGHPAIVVAPELWATGFAYPLLPELSQLTPELLTELQKIATRHNLHIAGSLVEKANHAESYFNTLYLVSATGVVGSYRKQRLFAPMAEDTFFSAGNCPGPMSTKFGAMASLICYDLRFPELARRQTGEETFLLLIPAQWPMTRLEHWQTLVRARAIENQLFVIAANRCGTDNDPQATEFAGHSMIVAPDGVILAEAGPTASVAGLMIDPSLTDKVRSRFNTATTL
jgi:predicted amidohydrolase